MGSHYEKSVFTTSYSHYYQLNETYSITTINFFNDCRTPKH